MEYNARVRPSPPLTARPAALTAQACAKLNGILTLAPNSLGPTWRLEAPGAGEGGAALGAAARPLVPSDDWYGARDALGAPSGAVAYASDFFPLWAGCCDAARARAAAGALQQSGLVGVGGIQASTLATGQQWDAPNCWAPLQDVVACGLFAVDGVTEDGAAAALGRTIVQGFVEGALSGWRVAKVPGAGEGGAMHEKMHAHLRCVGAARRARAPARIRDTTCSLARSFALSRARSLSPPSAPALSRSGERGAGGEYLPQEGFGWTNGAVLRFIEAFGASAFAP